MCFLILQDTFFNSALFSQYGTKEALILATKYCILGSPRNCVICCLYLCRYRRGDYRKNVSDMFALDVWPYDVILLLHLVLTRLHICRGYPGDLLPSWQGVTRVEQTACLLTRNEVGVVTIYHRYQ